MVNDTTHVEPETDGVAVERAIDPSPALPLVVLAADDDLVCLDDLCLPLEDRP